MKKSILIFSVFCAATFANAQIELKHGLLLGGGKGSLSGVRHAYGGYGYRIMDNAEVKITSGTSDYNLNAALGYKFRIENRNLKRWFYDVDLGFALRKISFHSEGEYVGKNENPGMYQSSGSYMPASFSVGLSAGYRIYKGFYAGIGIEPTYYFHDLSQFINVFDAPVTAKLGYDFKRIDIAITYKNGLSGALKSDHFSKGRINDLQVQLFIPF